MEKKKFDLCREVLRRLAAAGILETQMGAGTLPEVRGPKSEVGGPKTGKIIAFILFSCLAAVFCRSEVRKILFA